VRKGILVGVAVALLFTSGAAASGYLITSVKQIKPSVRKQLIGARGPRGYTGATGAPGPASTFLASDVTTIDGPPGPLFPGSQIVPIAWCPAGDVVIGGGFDTGPPNSIGPPPYAVSEEPYDNRAWQVILYDPTSGSQVSVYAIAICAG
jgi:hypothetical protein